MAKQPSKNDKKHRKLTKSPQVSCDMSMLSSSSSPIHSGFSISSIPSPSPKYIAYPSSLPNHYNDESLKRNFEYSRTDLSLTSLENASSTALPTTPTTYTTIPSPKRNDEPSRFQRYTNLSVKNPDPHRYNSENIHIPINDSVPSSSMSINTRVQPQQCEQMDQQTNFLYLTNQMTIPTIPTCCLKNSQHSSTSNDGVKTSPSSSTVFNDHLRQLKQLFQSSNSNTQNVNKNSLNSFGNESSSSSTNNNQKTSFSTTTKEHLTNENINHTNPFIFSNIFKSSNDKSTTTGNPGQTSSSISTSNTNPFLSENIKRDEFLKATMKICLVVSPPSNKLLQVM